LATSFAARDLGAVDIGVQKAFEFLRQPGGVRDVVEWAERVEELFERVSDGGGSYAGLVIEGNAVVDGVDELFAIDVVDRPAGEQGSEPREDGFFVDLYRVVVAEGYYWHGT
jgi:hypothetical protein